MSDIKSAKDFAQHLSQVYHEVYERGQRGDPEAMVRSRDAAVRAERDNEWRAAWSGSELMGPQGPHEVQAFLSGRDSVTRAVAYERVAKAFDNMPAVAAAIRQLAEETK